MAPRKKDVLSTVTDKTESAADAVDRSTSHLRQKTQLERVPSPVRFLLVVASSLILSSTLFTLSTGITQGELGDVSKHREGWWEVGGLTAWKAVEVGLAWILGFDGRDVSSFIFFTHLPTFALLASFYHIRPTTVLISYAVILSSTSIPFMVLRNPSSVHNLSGAPRGAVSNRSILQDRATTIYTTVAATSIFTVVLYISYATWIPAQLVLHFVNIPDISAVHAGPAGLPVLFVALLPAGWAARDFLFASSAGALASKSDSSSARQGEYLASAIYRKSWGSLSAKTRVLISRACILASMLVINTVVQLVGTVDGVDIQGASAWGSLWAVATFAVAGTFGWIEAVDGV
ncbi:hypothetical protein P170DRAFT_462761 [Aspergillus steynii IBT 23096]|uniref:Uncharacterized protein n=1 Tax=Aspergillus steynii IBT 23096 TaxID=1392250 RepID=A0A2I2GJ84_9EURO|nr:uncharacterized protein P170DRAFT_462761 [Aspergillus steynii IBT 23096]PLB52942.1 hypothetical protein P170DRAFT_462761 [Aspergillus steynii IBT 23096]